MTTLATFRSAISSKLSLTNTSGQDQPLIDGWVNEGVTDVLMRTGCYVRTTTISMSAGTYQYALSTSVMKILHADVTVGGNPYPLEQVGLDELEMMHLASSSYVSPAQFYAVVGADYFLIYPTPATADTVTIYYVPRPATLSASSDAPAEIPQEFQKAIEFYALAEGADMTDDSGSGQGQRYLQMYELWIRRIKRWVNTKGAHKLPVMTRRKPVLRLPYHDRSRYPR